MACFNNALFLARLLPCTMLLMVILFSFMSPDTFAFQYLSRGKIADKRYLPTSVSIQQNAKVLSSQSNSITLKSSEDDEIAKLEEQLKRLRAEKEQQQREESSLDMAATTTTATDSINTQDEQEEEISIDMFLSEGWKEKEAAELQSNGGFVGIFGAIALAIGLIVFSQIPVGQEDLSKYSAIKAPTQQIDLGDLNRARTSANDL